MNYPLISEYIEAIKSAEENFDELSFLRPSLDADAQPVISGGGFAVVFKMRDERDGKYYAVKCFLKEQEGRNEAYKMIADELEYVSSNYLTPIKYYEKELFVDTSQTEETEFPVLLMDWVEGKTIDKYIVENINNSFVLDMLAYQFCKLSAWLLTQPFAHGDLKPDNIIVREDGTLVLIDYDGMFVPSMNGMLAREVGSPGFRHPSRTGKNFDEHIDDFPIASISLSLKAIALKPSLYKDFGGNDILLFNERDYLSLNDSARISALQYLMYDKEFCSLYGIFLIAWSKNSLSDISYRLLNIGKSPKEDTHRISSLYIAGTEAVKHKDYENAFRLFSSLASEGNRSSIMLGNNGLGYLYANGLYVNQDFKQAVYYFKQAADRGWGMSIFNLGICYEKGLGVVKNQDEANRLYHLAAIKDFGPALSLESWFILTDPYSTTNSELEAEAEWNIEKWNEIVSKFYI